MRAPDNSPRLHVFHMRIRESSVFFRGHTLCRRLSKLRFSSFSGWNRRRRRFRAPRDQLAQLERGRTESPARIIICAANYFLAGKMRGHFFRGQGPSALVVLQRRNAGRAEREIPVRNPLFYPRRMGIVRSGVKNSRFRRGSEE